VTNLLSALAQNMALLLSLAFLYGLTRHRLQGRSILDPLLTGLLFALIAILSIQTGVEVRPGIVVDGRTVVLVLAGPFGSVDAALVAGALTAAYRLYLGGIAAPADSAVILSAAALGILWIWLKLPRPGRWLPVQLLAMGLVLTLLVLPWTHLLPAPVDGLAVLQRIALTLVLFYPLATLMLGLLLSYADVRRRELAALNANERLLRTVIEGSSDAIFLKDREGRYRLINQAGAAILGSSPEAVMGHTDSEINGGDTAREVMADDQRILDGGKTVHLEEVAKVAGERRTFFTMKAPYRDNSGQVAGLVGVARDITERARDENALRDSEVRYRSLFEHAGTAIYVFDPESRHFLDVNEHGGRWLGYS
jgi:PAS domain S-box-containing protein